MSLANIIKPHSSFYELCKACNQHNLHPEIQDNKIQDINQMENVMFYGPIGTGKYTQALRYIQKYSPTSLKWEKKINMLITCKSKIVPFILRLSDVHFEVNMSFLGCHPKIMWDEIYQQMMTIALSRDFTSIVICRDFHLLPPELVPIFYTYMKDYQKSPICSQKNLKFIFLTTSFSFIPGSIIKSCRIVRVARPTQEQYLAIPGIKRDTNTNTNNIVVSEITNITELLNVSPTFTLQHRFICDNIMTKMLSSDGVNHIEFRDAMYEIFTCSLNIFNCVKYIIFTLIKSGHINHNNIDRTNNNISLFVRNYDNNYRPIFHIERFLCQQILIMSGG